ncbi:DUF4214 domain-containing protein [Massilia sp. TS11]|uniref:DUF4214 domain-containing protein n=1 Tax=Massilia sp. TS11 TaxID=2908003 RepID=UPI001EDC47D4|nr:DUF4214 domain-containing protein [Massilia sp. TS11]MCG2586905.1 DUF4214 domain-containing protein [Massilia sp. TS11]
MRLPWIAGLLVLLLTACGGGDIAPPVAQQSATRVALGAPKPLPVVLSGPRSNYSVKLDANGYTVTDKAGNTRSLPITARLRFDDVSLSLDSDGPAGQAYRLYQAAFNHTPDLGGLGYWTDRLDTDATLVDIAQAFIDSAEFKATYGDQLSNLEFVKRLYQNVLHRPGDPGGLDYWTSILDKKQAPPAAVLAAFSESLENQLGVQASLQGGIAFLEAGVGYVPVAVPGPNTRAVINSVVTLDGSGSTAAVGRSLSYRWTMVAKPAGSMAGLVQSSSARPAFVPDLTGTYDVQLVVSDGARSSAPATVRITASWGAPPSIVPSKGNYIYLESDNGDYIGGGRSYLYTDLNAVLQVSGNGRNLSVSVRGDQNWSGDFVGMNSIAQFIAGLYDGLTRYPFNNPATGGLSWSGEGRGCNTLSGSFTIDSVTYAGTNVSAIDLRFEQHCEKGASALRGQIHWRKDDVLTAPGPVVPVPADLWQPAAGATPTTGNYVYLTGTSGDWVIGPNSYLYTQANATLRVDVMGNRVSVSVNGDKWWNGDFQAMNSISEMQIGYYPGLQRYPFHNANKGGLDWGGDGRGCNTLSGWFAVDNLVRTNGNITALDLRFEQHCEQGSSYARGKIHWSASDTTVPPGPKFKPADMSMLRK